MTEENWAAHGGIPACDLCHVRKVKCDRQDPCKSCVIANAQCLRKRQKRAPHPRLRTDDKIKALVQKLASLEDVVKQTAPQAIPTTSASTLNSNLGLSEEKDASPRRPSKRSRIDATRAHTLLSPQDCGTSQLQRDHIEKELSNNESLASHQRRVFEIAIAFIDQLSQAPSNFVHEDFHHDKVPTDFAKGELLQIALACQQKDLNRPDVQLSVLDHIPPTALERMAFCLLDGTADERTLNMCKVVVHFKAGLSLYASQLQAPKNPTLHEHVKQMQLHHLSAGLTALDAVSFTTLPSLLLLQALLTGAVLMYIVGNSASCWNLTAHASRTLIALGYHNVQDAGPKNEQDQEIYAAVAWCYHLDRVMSLLLLRPPSLPPLQVPISSLVSYSPDNPMAIFTLVMLELVPIHDKILELSFPAQASKTSSEADITLAVEALQKKMDDIYTTMEQARANNLAAHNADYALHAHSLAFKFFSTLTAVRRLSPTVCTSPSERSKCLDSARRALQCVKAIHDLAKQQDHFLEEYNPYLAWTVLSYPLAPFFVLFCNIVGTSNAQDYQLLQHVVESVSSLAIENKYVERLRRLCNTLLALCRPLVEQSLGLGVVEQQQEEEEQQQQHDSAIEVPPSEVTISPLDTVIASSNDDGTTLDGVSATPSPWQDEIMAQLFQHQPSLDWFNSDILDPESWDLNLPPS